MYNTPEQFARHLNRFLTTISELVRASQRMRQQHQEDWPESALLETLVSSGFRGGDPRTQALRFQLEDGEPYSFTVTEAIHHSVKKEPLTGADVALLFAFRVDNVTVARRVVLVQLKRTSDVGRSVSFPHLHHYSGEQVFGRDLHQAQRMLIFSDHSVYWLSISPDAVTDSAFASAYLRQAPLVASRHSLLYDSNVGHRRRYYYEDWHRGRCQHVLRTLSAMNEWDDKRWSHYLRHEAPFFFGDREIPSPVPEDLKEAARNHHRQFLLFGLQHAFLCEAATNTGLRNALPLSVCHAETVLAHSAARTTTAGDLLATTVPLPEFLLVDVLTRGFGDDNEELIDAMMCSTPTDYIRKRVREYTNTKLAPDSDPPVRSVVKVEIGVGPRIVKE